MRVVQATRVIATFERLQLENYTPGENLMERGATFWESGSPAFPVGTYRVRVTDPAYLDGIAAGLAMDSYAGWQRDEPPTPALAPRQLPLRPPFSRALGDRIAIRSNGPGA